MPSVARFCLSLIIPEFFFGKTNQGHYDIGYIFLYMAKILLIDDDEYIRMWTSIHLDKAGHQTTTAADGDPGINLASKIKFDLVITDIIMPDKEGLETIIELKKGNPDLPIIAMSGGGHMSSDDILELALSLGANAVLRKPFDGSELIALVESCLAPISDS